MAKKLWTGNVSIDFEMAIYAESEAEALELAKRYASEELGNIDSGDFDIRISPHAPPKDLDDALPWGDFDSGPEKTVRQLKDELGVEHPTQMLMARVRAAATEEGAGS